MTDAALPGSGKPLVAIQALRAAAAGMVLFGHLQTEIGQHSPGFAPINYPWGIGVDIFFIISGLIMVISSQHLFGKRSGPAEFLKRRLVRVVPIYWLYTTLAAVAVIALPGKMNIMRWDNTVVLSSYLFFPAYRWDQKITPLLSLGWTLNYEMFFYVLFALSLWIRPKYLSAILLCALLSFLALLGNLYDFSAAPLKFWLDGLILEFAFGIALGWTFLLRPDFRSQWLLAAIPLGFAATDLQILNSAPRFLENGIPAFLIVAGCLWGFSDRLANLVRPIADWLGESSYSLYLSHPFSVGLIVLLWPLPMGEWDWTLVLAGTVGAIIAGVLSHRLVERPVTRFLQSRVVRKTSGRDETLA